MNAVKQDIQKSCADSLRTFVIDKYKVKLKPTHAHELVAAYFGYRSKNAMLADSKYPINNLDQAEIVVLTPDAFIQERRENLSDFPPDLPDSYSLGEAIYIALFSGERWVSQFPPFRSFEKLAQYLVENSEAYRNVFNFSTKLPVHHFVEVEKAESYVLLTVLHSHQISNSEFFADGCTTIKLPRVSGRIGFGTPKLSVEGWAGSARKRFKPIRLSDSPNMGIQ